MEIPKAAIEAAATKIEFVTGFTHPNTTVVRNGSREILRAALPALQEQWESEQLEAMRSDQVIQRLTLFADGLRHQHGQADLENVAREIIDYLTSPQIQASADDQD